MERRSVRADNYRKIVKPTVDVSLCEMCNKMTDRWYSKWPNWNIVWLCEKCMEKTVKQNRTHLETILEKMCEEEC